MTPTVVAKREYYHHVIVQLREVLESLDKRGPLFGLDISIVRDEWLKMGFGTWPDFSAENVSKLAIGIRLPDPPKRATDEVRAMIKRNNRRRFGP